MKTIFAVVLTAIALGASPNILAAESAAHSHSHGSVEPTKLHLNAGKKWATDEPLRQAMNDINQAMARQYRRFTRINMATTTIKH